MARRKRSDRRDSGSARPVDATTLQVALDDQKKSGRKLGRVIVDRGLVTEEVICGALARQIGVPFVDLRHFNTRPDAIKLLSEAQARRFRALVLEDRGNQLRLGMVDPTDLFAYDELARILKKELELAVVSESALLATIDRVYSRSGEITNLAQELTADMGDVPIDFGALLGAAPGVEEAPVVRLLRRYSRTRCACAHPTFT